MLTPTIIGWLRRNRWWRSVRSVYAGAAIPICGAIHSVVRRFGPTIVPISLYLKHRYDYELLYVDPRRINHTIKTDTQRGQSRGDGLHRLSYLNRVSVAGAWKSVKRHPSRNLYGSFIADGDWDQRKQPFEVRPLVWEIIIGNGNLEATEEYRKMRARVEARDFRWTKHCRSVDDVDRYFGDLKEALTSISVEGYKTQEQLGNPDGDEVRVCVDREGDLCIFGGGTHRLSAAKVLDLKVIAVVLKRVHRSWVQGCSERYGGSVHEAIHAGLLAYAANSEANEVPFPTPGTTGLPGQPGTHVPPAQGSSPG